MPTTATERDTYTFLGHIKVLRDSMRTFPSMAAAGEYIESLAGCALVVAHATKFDSGYADGKVVYVAMAA